MQKDVLAKLKSIIDPVYLVGGAVRDLLLGNITEDFDFATPLLPDSVIAQLEVAGRMVDLTGKEYGSVSSQIDGHHLEITTFRKDTYTPGSRKPQVIFITDLEEDLGRRDFTINAIAFDGEGYIDPFNGRADLAAKTLRSLGNPDQKFQEDPLRILRAIRFVGQLGLTIEEETSLALARQVESLQEISHERWSQELDKLLITDHVADALVAAEHHGVTAQVLPDLKIEVTESWNRADSLEKRWADLIRASHFELEEMAQNLRWSRVQTTVVRQHLDTAR